MDGTLHRQLIGEVKDGNALDIGAHVGIWSRQLVTKFHNVYAWEPIESNCECLILRSISCRFPLPEF